jgi:hypothetical protein
MMSAIPEVVVGLLAAPLAVAGLVKLAVPAERMQWPYDRGPLAPPRGPRLVGTAECGAAVLLIALPGWPAGVLAGVAYGSLAVVAHRLRGRRCACFGAARLAAVGRAHIGANVAAAAAGLAVAPLESSWSPAARLLSCAVASVAVLSSARYLDRRAGGAGGEGEEGEAASLPCDEPIWGVRLYVSEDCPACRSLRYLLGKMDDARRSTVSTVVVGGKESVPEAFRRLGVPAATALDAAGRPVCSPVSGIGDVKALVDRVTVRTRDEAVVG